MKKYDTMPKSNVTLFTGENTLFIEREREKWLELFTEKHGAHNISRLYPSSARELVQSELTTLPFLAEKRLVILEDFMVKISSDDGDETPTVSADSGIEQWLIDHVEDIPDTTVVVFIQAKPGLTNKLYKKLLQVATVRRFEELAPTDLRTYVKSRLPNIEFSAISKLLAYKNNHLASIDAEIEKLGLFKADSSITDADIETYVISDIETNIFRLLDGLLALDRGVVLREFTTLLSTNSVFAVFSGLMSNLRRILYIQILLRGKYAPSEIIEILEIKPFWIEKHARFKANISRLADVFDTLVDIERQTKTGESVGDGEAALELALERVFFTLG